MSLETQFVIFCPQCDLRECLVMPQSSPDSFIVSCAACGYSEDSLVLDRLPHYEPSLGGSMPPGRAHVITRNEDALAKAS